MTRIIEDVKLGFDDVSILPQPTELSSRSEVNLEVKYITKHSKRMIHGLPVLVANMDKIGEISMAKALQPYKIGVCLHKFVNTDETIKFLQDDIKSGFTYVSTGISEEEMHRLNKIKDSLDKDIPRLRIDCANGYMYSFLDRIKQIREWMPETIILAGNVCTPEGVENVIKAGADAAVAGISNGGLCDTAKKAGIGSPQWSVAKECGQAANELNALCISDGSVKYPADICKALGAGSHMVLCGSIFYGYKENNTEWQSEEYAIDINPTKKSKMQAYGMSSTAANNKFFGGLKEYRTSEGKEKWIDYKGYVSELAKDIRGGLASCCTYVNCKNLENISKCCTFVRNK